MQRYFLNEPYKEQPVYHLVGDDFHHAVHVMRMKIEEQCFLSFNDEITIIARVSGVLSDCVELVEEGKETMIKELPYDVTIACGYTKGDKLEWVAQKATELGMTGLIGFPGTASVVKWDSKKLAKKHTRFKRIVKEAAEQSHRQVIPTIDLLTSFNELVDVLPKYDIVLVAYEESAKQGEQVQLVHALQSIRPKQRILVVFGPEGGIIPAEVKKLEKSGAVLCGLGPRILRAETAPLYLLSVMSYQWELLTDKKL